MNKGLKLNLTTNEIIVAKAFSKKAAIYGSPEYQELQECRKDNPNFKLVVRTIKKCANKESYKGLTYAYIENYIKSHVNAKERMAKYKELKLLSECHRKRYSVIKNWFLDTYPEVKQYGTKTEEPTVIQMPTDYIETEEKKEKAS